MERRRMVDGGSVIIKNRRRGEERREKLENYITSYKQQARTEWFGRIHINSVCFILIFYYLIYYTVIITYIL
jgi:hypothetical protein